MDRIDIQKQQYVDYRLRDWARWIFRIEDGSEGWPSETMLFAMLTMGQISPTSAKSIPPYTNPLAEEINSIVNKLDVLKPKCATALRIYYLRSNNQSLKSILSNLNIPKSSFHDSLNDAKIFVINAL